MLRSTRHTALRFSGVVLALLFAVLVAQAPSIAAGGLLHPGRSQSRAAPPPNCLDRDFTGDGVRLRGWYCHAAGDRRGTMVYLHGIADNRGSAVGPIQRFTARGLDVVAYDSRRHGSSDGEICTYGFYEKNDLRRVIDALDGPIVLVGTSLGAAVVLQEAAIDDRIRAVVAAEVFSDLKTIARDRAPFFLPESIIRKAFEIAGERGRFDLDAVSPVIAARSIRAPVLLIHGDSDTETSAEHSKRVFAVLPDPKRLILVPGAGHNDSLGDEHVWTQIDEWIERAIPGAVSSR
jgi:uncharacterized protein